jgi:ankyrin repeat protein
MEFINMFKIWILIVSLFMFSFAQNEKSEAIKEDTKNKILLNAVKVSDTLLALEKLKQSDLDLSYKDTRSGKTALHYAVEKKNIEIIDALLEKGANINAIDNNGNTPLHLALEELDKEFLKYLLEKSPDINLKNNDGYSVINLAITNREVMALLIENSNNLGEALNDSINMVEPLVVKDLIKKGIKVDSKGMYGNQALHVASTLGNIEIAEILLENQASFQVPNDYGETPLEIAIENGNLEVFDLYNEQIQNIRNSMKKNSKYTKKEKNTIIDNENKIAWQTTLSDERMTYDKAKEYCLSLDLDYYNDYRLPTIDELISIVDSNKYKPATDEKSFPNTQPYFYWTSSSTGVLNQYETVDFNYGDRLPKNKDEKLNVRCVRSMD